ncbi:DUF3703 domain-containing protein [Iamia sp. SCSIO 61187]|uniref:DUF3703 domain-containing protein n=1 Tax=Iamia sp. SCSIO 61187 TaxID=2722752 RepID=UPI001C63B669|nr:DUF3703 domain-containing protein [Iamia sp. SCSIO 61187]
MARRPMPDAVRNAFDAELQAAGYSEGQARWDHLERAHILSQPWAWPHVKVHGLMLRQGLRERDRREAIGQVVRLIVAGPGSLAGRYPSGNSGRATVPMMKPAPVPPDLAALLDRV